MAVVVTLLALGHFTLYTYISPLLLHDGIADVHVGAVLFAYGYAGVLALVAASAVVVRRPGEALVVDIVLMLLSLVLAAAVASTIGIIAVVVVWGVAFGAFLTLTQTVMLRAANGANDAATALVNATTNIGIAGERSSAPGAGGRRRARSRLGRRGPRRGLAPRLRDTAAAGCLIVTLVLQLGAPRARLTRPTCQLVHRLRCTS